MSDPVTTFTWSINTLERHTSSGIVYTVHYNINATDGTYLTEELVLQWTKSALGGDEKVTEIQNALQARIDEKRTPTKAHGKPWE